MYLVNQAASGAMLWAATSERPSLVFSWRSYRDLLDFGLKALGVEAMAVSRSRGGDLLIGVLLGETALGFFYMGRTIVGGVFGLVDGAIGQVVWATLSRLQSSPRRLARALEESAQLTAAVVLPVGAGLLLTAAPSLERLYGDQWLPALPVLHALVVCRMLSAVAGHNRLALSAVGAVNVHFVLSGVSTGLTLAGTVAGSPWGLAGVALGLVAATAVQTPIDLLCSFRMLQVSARSYLMRLVMPSLVTLAMFLSVRALGPWLGQGWPALVLMAVVGALIYTAGTWLAAPDLVSRVRTNLLAGMGQPGPVSEE
jgi:O-antigen/teichoic acid export membrane protein